MMKKTIWLLFALILMQGAFARLELDSISFDPAIIAAGDEVDIIIQFRANDALENGGRVGNPDYTFMTTLLPDDSLTRDYVEITDGEGDDIRGSLFSGQLYNKRFRVKVDNNAPAGNYEFKLEGRWYNKDVAEEGSQFLKFMMPVKKEGIILDIATINTVPAEVKPGKDYVRITSFVENAGEKDAKSVEVRLKLPEGLESSYTNNNRVWIGRVNAGESKEADFFVDVDELAEAKIYTISYYFEYMDLDDNQYKKIVQLPFLVKERPYINIVDVKGEGFAGESAKLYITVKNTGSESAESVDVRILKQNAQPFSIDVRSDYIGELEPGEEGLAVFDISVNREAELKEHDFKLLIRLKGDSDKGDDTIYTYNRRAKFKVTGTAPNNNVRYGLIGAGIVIILIISGRISKRRKKK